MNEQQDQKKMIVIGVLALQGAFQEHINVLKQLNVKAIPVKTPQELEMIDGLIIPGGESTAITIVAERTGMWQALESWLKYNKPVWGTCAGMILLSKSAKQTKEGGQKLLGALDIVIKRNAFGTQLESFIRKISMPVLEGSDPFPGVFIRAPLVDSIENSNVQILATIEPPVSSKTTSTMSSNPNNQQDHNDTKTTFVVAVQQNHILATAFHPELTQDKRCHAYFVKMVERKIAEADEVKRIN